MKDYLQKTFILLIFCFVFISCETRKIGSDYVIVVKVPPHPTNNQGSLEEQYWRGQKLLFPQRIIPDQLPPGIPNDDSLILVKIEETGDIKIGSDVVASLSNTEGLFRLLKENFDARAKRGVYEPDSNKVLTATAIKADLSLKYEDVLEVIAAVKASGADPIALQLDELSR